MTELVPTESRLDSLLGTGQNIEAFESRIERLWVRGLCLLVIEML